MVARIRRVIAPPPRTLRLDYVHTGTATAERFALERWVEEPLPWPGNPVRPLDGTNLGPYAFEVVDAATQQTLYSRGFASIFGEWQTTAEAKVLERAFPESVRFPAPGGPARVVLKKRNAQGYFAELASFALDPADPAIDRAAPPPGAPVLALQQSGEPATKVDLLLLGDGYTAAEQADFEADARRLMELLFAQEPFAAHRGDFNVWAYAPPAAESGISRPSTGIHRRSPVGTTYDAFGSERYVLTFDDRAFREAASQAPYDFVEILVNGATYGGGGIYQLYGTVAADSAWAPYVLVHEFGHHFAALADEYYTSPVAYEAATGPRVEPWEKNVTADPSGAKWRDLIAPGTPLPTPWAKEAYEAFQRDVQARRRALRAGRRPEAEMDALFREEQARATQLLAEGEHAHHVGAFEGASYEAKGLYRPQADCLMFTRDDVGFCAVCRRAIDEVIRLYAE
ncbi:MAG TPA: M64 family metallopeptidase [Thermoanaerobaculia bacterium]|nr:M64 family metallopeptidase [Thermoanaerobaculia bacterium]